MSEWPVGLSTGCLCRSSLFDCLESIRDAGFSMLEICSLPSHFDYRDARAVSRAAELLKKLHLEPYSFHAPFADHIDITSPNERHREVAFGELVTAAEAAARLGCRYIVIHPGPERSDLPPGEHLQRLENAARVLDQVALRCREFGLGLVLENMLPHLFSGQVRDLMWILGCLEASDVGVCLDTGHAYLSRGLHGVAHKLLGHLWMVHCSDNRGQYDDHLPPGQGDIDWEKLLLQLARRNFRGALMLEIADTGDNARTLEGAQRARSYLRSASSRLDLNWRVR